MKKQNPFRESKNVQARCLDVPTRNLIMKMMEWEADKRPTVAAILQAVGAVSLTPKETQVFLCQGRRIKPHFEANYEEIQTNYSQGQVLIKSKKDGNFYIAK